MWKGHNSIFGAFTPMDMNPHSVAVDIGNLKVKGLLQSKPAGIYHGQTDIIVKGFNLLQDTVHFFTAQNTRKLLLSLGLQDLKNVPIPQQNTDEKNLSPE